MSNHASSGHPLDTDLMELVGGSLSPDAVRSVETHLAGCVLCRIKRQRLANEPPIAFVDLHDVEIPTFGRIETVDVSPATARPGELWLTYGDEATMVLVRKVLGPSLGLVVVPVTMDTEVADSGTLVLDATASPLGIPLAIYDGMLSSLPVDSLIARVVPKNDVDLLTLTVAEPGVRRGSPLEGPGDPRHEVRQYIADRLTALFPVVDDAANIDESPDVEAFEAFEDQLDGLRNGGTTVEPFSTPAACPDGWRGLGQVLERHLSVLVIGTPAGLITESDYVAARGLALRWHASALVICPRHGTTVDLYTPRGLYDASQVPLGHRSPEPTTSGLDLIDSVRKFFDQHPLWHVPAASESGQVPRVDVVEVLERTARVATAKLVERNVRGAGKPDAYKRASARGDQLASVLKRALEGDLAPEDIRALADREPG